jgi:protein-L-isoaspartate(D-aspartate) O-methyltransferase
MNISYDKQLEHMVESQIEARGIRDPEIIRVFKKVPRHLFVPEAYRGFAFDDGPVSIGEGQTISQPYIVAYMTDLLELKKEDKVLEIGTGSGYQTAILAELAREVYTVEIRENLSKKAQRILKKLGYQNIYFRVGDGFEGWIEYAPYDKIILTAAPREIPENLFDQLKRDGIMVLPVGPSFLQYIYRIKKSDAGIQKEKLLAVRFVEMVKGNE